MLIERWRQGVQHDQAAQFAGLPATGARDDPAVSTGFRSAPAGANGLCSIMNSGTTNGGGSRTRRATPTAIRVATATMRMPR